MIIRAGGGLMKLNAKGMFWLGYFTLLGMVIWRLLIWITS